MLSVLLTSKCVLPVRSAMVVSGLFTKYTIPCWQGRRVVELDLHNKLSKG